MYGSLETNWLRTEEGQNTRRDTVLRYQTHANSQAPSEFICWLHPQYKSQRPIQALAYILPNPMYFVFIFHLSLFVSNYILVFDCDMFSMCGVWFVLLLYRFLLLLIVLYSPFFSIIIMLQRFHVIIKFVYYSYYDMVFRRILFKEYQHKSVNLSTNSRSFFKEHFIKPIYKNKLLKKQRTCINTV